MQTTFSLKVDARFAKDYRAFCDEHCLQVGKFTEKALREIMEDYHFGDKALRVLARSRGGTVSHDDFTRR